MAAYLICLIVGYFCGCISTGYFVGKFYHMDIRTKGSGNAGTTNVLRNLGKLPALITFVGDLAKAIVPILVIRLAFAPEQWYLWCLYCGLGVVLGHRWQGYCCDSSGCNVCVSSADDPDRSCNFYYYGSTDPLCIGGISFCSLVYSCQYTCIIQGQSLFRTYDGSQPDLYGSGIFPAPQQYRPADPWK